jgi:OmpA-OmpF porin, OOP family
MKKLLASVIFALLLQTTSFSQETSELRAPAIGVSFFFNDFTTPQRIRSSALTTVLIENNWADFREMSPGLALTYFNGVHKRIDFAGTLGASFVKMPEKSSSTLTEESLLLEGDASFHFKMFPEKFVVTPYAIGGFGASYYKSSFGAFLPLGAGIKVNFFDEASLFLSMQYRVPLTTETNNYHFVTSIGISGIVGKKNSKN